jgi:hypothetical protein
MRPIKGRRTSTPERWFGARVIFEVQVDREPTSRRRYEDRVIVLRARSEATARKKAEKTSRAKDASYLSIKGQKVSWRFKELIDVYEVGEEIADGTEVYSAFQTASFYRRVTRGFHSGILKSYIKAHPRRTDPTVGDVLAWARRTLPARVRQLEKYTPQFPYVDLARPGGRRTRGP